MHRIRLCFLLCLSSLAFAGDGVTLGIPRAGIRGALESTGNELRKMSLELEVAGFRARLLERGPQPAEWEEAWERTHASRELIQARYAELDQRLQVAAIEDQGERDELQRQLLTDWLGMGEPALIRAHFRTSASPLEERCGLYTEDSRRRDLLHAVLLREAWTPGHDDLDALIEVLEWEALLLDESDGLPLEQLSTDLILLFSDRAADGFTLSGADYYKTGVFLDRGLRADLKDASNQLRHLCWALRLFSISEDLDATEKLLRFKEQRDAITRKLPLNEADLELNRTARALVERMRDASVPLTLAELPALFRAALGPAAREDD